MIYKLQKLKKKEKWGKMLKIQWNMLENDEKLDKEIGPNKARKG